MLSLQLMKYAIVPILIMCLTACHVKTKQANKRGLEYMKQNRYEQAVAEFNDILQEDAYWLPAYYNRANLFAMLGDYHAAIVDYNKVLELDADFADAYYNRGLTYIYLGNNQQGIADLSKAGELGLFSAYNVIKRFTVHE